MLKGESLKSANAVGRKVFLNQTETEQIWNSTGLCWREVVRYRAKRLTWALRGETTEEEEAVLPEEM